MDFSEGKTVVEMIREKYNQIFMAERKVADFVLENPERAVNANVSELANLSGVSDATVIRFCKRIGFQGHYQFRITLSRDLGRIMGGHSRKENEGEDQTAAGLFQSYARKISAIGKHITDETMKECVNLLKSAGYVHVVATGNTTHLARYMGFRLGRLGIRCTYNDLPEYFFNHINLAEPEDVVFAISESGSSKQVVQALELAKEKGLKTIAVTGYEYSPMTKLADCLLLSVFEEQNFDYYKTYSHLKEIAVLDAVLEFLSREESISQTVANQAEMILSETKI